MLLLSLSEANKLLQDEQNDKPAICLLAEVDETITGCKQRNKNSKRTTLRDSNVVPHRSTNRARQCLTSQSERDAVLSLLYGRS